jgi:hypothetical protein
MRLCKHQPHTVIDWIKEPRYHDDHVLIRKESVDGGNEHLLIKFTACSKYPDWFYMSRAVVRRHKTQGNGSGTVYVVPMGKRESLEIIKPCEHSD